MKTVLIILAAALAAACQTTAYQGNESSPYYRVPAGSHVILNRDLTIPAEQVGVYMQGGQVMPQNQLNMYHAHCKLEVRTRRDVSQVVRADEFVVTKSVQEALIYSVQAEPRTYADASRAVRVNGMDDSGGQSVQTYATRLDLRSERQPDVLRLTCAHWDHPNTAVHLSIRQIRAALGDVVTLRLAGKGS
jgi:hypothetical protein